MKRSAYKKYSKADQLAMATWALDCAERILYYFEKAYPQDGRPRAAIAAGRMWVETGVFRMAEIRGASLGAHAAAREAGTGSAACFAARAAGQAVATAHVTQHAYGSAYYALKAIAATDPDNAETDLKQELDWQSQHLPEHLREEVMSRITVTTKGKKILIRIRKGAGF